MSTSKRAIPAFSQPMIDTHCHLDYLKERPLDELIKCALEANIQSLITIAVSPANQQTVRDLLQLHPMIYGTQGVHPHDADQLTQDGLDEIRAHIGLSKMVAVGEIGLDYHYEHSPRAVQRKVFEAQLQVAVDHNKPVVIHTREADEDTRAILANFSRDLKKRGVIHSFSSGMALASFCLDEGYALGFNGMCTFNKADNVREILRYTPATQILLETDAPYLTPVPYRGQENAPFYLPFIAEKIAQIKALTIDDLLAQVYKNSVSVFGLHSCGKYPWAEWRETNGYTLDTE